MKKIVLVLAVALVGLGFVATSNDSNGFFENSSQVDIPTSSPISTPDSSREVSAPLDDQAALAWKALMDPTGEYAAFAMYSAVIEQFGEVEPYVSIRAAEQRHIDALIRQLSRYGVTVPGNPYLGNVEAPNDLATAANNWATGEIDNVALYDDLLALTQDSNLVRVFNNLKDASLNMHLPMFEKAAANGGVLTAEQMAGFMHG